MQVRNWKRLYGCGALNWDSFYEIESLDLLKHCCPDVSPGSELVFEESKFSELREVLNKKGLFIYECGGGSAANTIYALSSWGFETGFVGAVGEDPYGERILKELNSKGVDTTFICKKGATSRAIIVIDKNKDRFIAVCPGNAESYLSMDSIKEHGELRESYFHLSSFASDSGINFQLELLRWIDKKCSFDPGEVYCRKGRSFCEKWFPWVEVLFLTEEETALLKMKEEEFFDLGMCYVFLKMGSKGAKVFTQNEEIFLPSFPVEIHVDNTGAGDYFNAGVIAGLKLGLPVEAALRLGTFCASQSLKSYGRSGCISYKEFKNYLNLLK